MALRLVKRGWTVVFEMSKTVPASPEMVWRVITDWERQGEWMLEASDFAVTSPQREGIGVEAQATIKIAGIATRDRVRVIAWEPPYCLAIEHLGWVRGTGRIHLAPVSRAQTHVLWREQLDPPLGLAGAIGLSVLKPVMARVFRRDLEVLAQLVASRALA